MIAQMVVDVSAEISSLLGLGRAWQPVAGFGLDLASSLRGQSWSRAASPPEQGSALRLK